MAPGSLSDTLAQALIEAAPDGIVIVDAAGTIVFANNEATTLFDFPRADLVGRTVESLLDPDLAASHRAHRAGYSRSPHRRPMASGLVLEARRRDGKAFPVEISLSPLHTDEGDFVIAAVRDVTQREENARALRDAEAHLALVEERDRIARDLHDTVIQHLFGVGMNLQSVERQLTDANARARIQWAVDHLDETIREVRSVIFGLQSKRGPGGVRARIAAMVNDAGRILGFTPRLRFDGLLDARVPDDLADHVAAVVRESLSNVARHSGASHADVLVAASDHEIEVRVSDNGRGINATDVRGDGIANLEQRAHTTGGSFQVSATAEGGTVVAWRAPLR